MRPMHASSSSTGEISLVPMRRRSSTAVSSSSCSLVAMRSPGTAGAVVCQDSRTIRGGTLVIIRLVAALMLLHAAAASAAYPDRPLRYVMGSAAGGGPDIAARIVMAQLGRQLGQQIVIENRPGASGSIGTDVIARATPDGYTIGHGNIQTLAIARNLMKLPYDIDRDLQPVI